MTANATPTSPLDIFLRDFLRHIRDAENGFSTGQPVQVAAAALDLPDAFVEALFVSARTRGFLKPHPVGRNRYRWTVSAPGERFAEGTVSSPGS